MLAVRLPVLCSSRPADLPQPSAEPISISYKTLVNAPDTLTDLVSQAFGAGPDCLGIIVVKDLPENYPTLRGRLLRLASQFAELDETTREKYADPSTRYSFGWSHGRELMNGKPDTLKGSYYANLVDHPNVSDQLRKAYKEYYGDNVWPSKDEKGVEGFEEAFKALTQFVFAVGCQVAGACQSFASSHLRDQSISLPQLISSSQTTKARLLHYFPPPPSTAAVEEEPIDSWCGFHLDHSLLTGLCSALYLSHRPGEPVSTSAVVPPPSPSTGLYIRTRGGKLVKVSIPTDCLAFQTGEALEIATDGRLRATPHCVHVGGGSVAPDGTTVTRSTFALFMQPETEQSISDAETFGDFSKRIFDDHYEKQP